MGERWGWGGAEKVGYLILLSVVRQRRLWTEAGALAGALVLPSDGATRFIRDTLNLSV